MKIKNFAFFGVMASILGTVSGAYADSTTDAKIIASKNYVDTQITGLTGSVSSTTTASSTAVTGISQTNGKITATTGQITGAAISDKDTSIGESSSASDAKVPTTKAVASAIETAVASGNTANSAVTNALTTNALAVTSDSDKAKLTKASAIQDAITTGVTGTVSGWDSNARVDTKIPTVKAVGQQLDLKLNVADTISTDVLAASENDGGKATQVQAIKAAVDTAASATWANNTLTIAKTGAGNQNKLATSAQVASSIGAVQSLINYKNDAQDTEIGKKEASANKATSSTLKDAATFTSTAGGDNGDTLFPTVKAVETRVAAAQSAAETTASNMKDTAASATWDATDKALSIITTANTAGNKTDKVATSNQVQTSVSALKSYIDNNQTNAYGNTGTTPVTGTAVQAAIRTGTNNKLAGDTTTYAPSEKAVRTELDLKLDKNSAITASGDTKMIVTYGADGLVTGGTAAGVLATKDAVDSSEITNGAIMNDDINSSADIDYSKMANSAIAGINSSTASSNYCTNTNPCTLTYLGSGNFKWTPMDLNGLTVTATATSN